LALQEFQQTLQVISTAFQAVGPGRTSELKGTHEIVKDAKALRNHFKASMERLEGAVHRKLLASRLIHTPSEWNDLIQAMVAEYNLQVFAGDSNSTFTLCGAVFVIDVCCVFFSNMGLVQIPAT
jgi:hypothetical protein